MWSGVVVVVVVVVVEVMMDDGDVNVGFGRKAVHVPM